MKRLYFIRHGLSEANKLGVFGGQGDHALTPEGQQQAKQAGRGAKELGIDLIVSSPLSRAVETAKLIAQEIGYPPAKIITNQLLVERNFGELEGKKWIRPPGIDYSTIKGLENDDSLLKRAEQAFAWLETLPANNILVVSHGAFGRALRKVAVAEHDFYEQIPNAQLVCWVSDER